MTKIIKETIPESLRLHSEKWTNQLLEQYIQNDNDSSKVNKTLFSKYNKDDVKAALIKESFSKCMYCDTKIGVAEYGNIEHIKPKKINPELTFKWENLGWCCVVCNTKKGQSELLNPYEIDFEDKLTVTFSLLLTEMFTEDYDAKLFISTLDLNSRADLVAKRCQECSNFEFKLSKMKKMYENNDPNIDIYVQIMKNEFKEDKEYYMFKKTIFRRFTKFNEIQLETV
ncbi:MAG: HNH endonuclease [Carnobacterium sp.]|uniref:HNH endonuclease n=1 Tax=Carnobacterium sp. TaxID=48221 RepID=UPI0033149BF6